WKSPVLGAVVDSSSQDTTNRIISLVPYSRQDFLVAPNPSWGEFRLITQDRSWIGKSLQAQIVDIQGGVVWTGELRIGAQGAASVRTSGLRDGVYTLILNKGNQVVGRLRLIFRSTL